jgi:MFS family permease
MPEPRPPANLRTNVSALREPNFRWQFAAQATSLVGDHVAPIALAFAVLQISDSATSLGVALLARQLPLAVFVLAAGVWADRLPRHRIMLAADGVRFGTQTLLGVLVIAGVAQLWHFVVLLVANGVATAFFQPAATGLTPLTVSRERLQQANALISLWLGVAVILGPILGGGLVVLVGAGWGLVLDGATFAVSALCLARVRIPPRATVPAREGMREELAAGWSEVRSRRWLWVGILNLSLFQLLLYSTYFVLGPLLAKHGQGGAASWGLVVTMWGAGAMLAGATGLRLRPRRPLVGAFVALAAVAPGMILLGLAAPRPLVVGAAVVAGAGMVLGSILWETTVQSEVPEHALSRVAAYDWAGSMALRPLGYAAVGPLAGAIGARWTLVGAAGLLLASQVVSVLALGPNAVEQRRPGGSAEVGAVERAHA